MCGACLRCWGKPASSSSGHVGLHPWSGDGCDWTSLAFGNNWRTTRRWWGASRLFKNRSYQPADGLESPKDAAVAHLVTLLGHQRLVVGWRLGFDLASHGLGVITVLPIDLATDPVVREFFHDVGKQEGVGKMWQISSRPNRNALFQSQWHSRFSLETMWTYATRRWRNEMLWETPTSLRHRSVCSEWRSGTGVVARIAKSRWWILCMLAQANLSNRCWMFVKWRQLLNVSRSPNQLWWEQHVVSKQWLRWENL